MARQYVYIKGTPVRDLGDDAKVSLSDAMGEGAGGVGVLEGIATGTALGTSVPGVGNVVGGIAGGVAGLTGGIFFGPDEAALQDVIPILVAKALAKKGSGARAEFVHGPPPNGPGKKGVKISGRQYEPQKVLDLVKQININIGENASTHTREDAIRFNSYIHVGPNPPNMNKVIVSFPKKVSRSDVTDKVTTYAKSSGSMQSVFIAAAIGVGGFLLIQSG